MKKIALKPDGPEFSRLVYGAWRLADDAEQSLNNVRNKIDICLEQGISSFDHADIYGDYQCEALFGQALKDNKSLRSSMELISKCDIALASDAFPGRRLKYYDTSSAYINMSVENSLKNLNTDYLDLLLIHRPDPLMDAAETGAALDKLIDDGKIRSAGISNFQSWDWRLLQANMKHPLVVNQIEMSLLCRDSFLDGTLANMQIDNISAMAWSPLAGGDLFGNSEAALRLKPLLENLAKEHDCGTDAIAVAWLLHHPAQILPIVGTNNIERMMKLSRATEITLDRETWFELWCAATGQEVP